MIKYICMLFVFSLTSCISHGALTPGEGVSALKEVINEKDIKEFKKILSSESIEKVNVTISLIKEMKEPQRSYVLTSMGFKKGESVNADRLIELIYFNDTFTHPLRLAVKGKVISVKKENKRVKINFTDGHFLHFVKEGPYWKLDITDL